MSNGKDNLITGVDAFDVNQRHKEFDAFLKLSPGEQVKSIKKEWVEAAFILASRMKRASKSTANKDFGKVSAMVQAASVAYANAVPKVEAVKPQNLIVQMFGELDRQKLLNVVSPEIPTINVREVPEKKSRRKLAHVPAG